VSRHRHLDQKVVTTIDRLAPFRIATAALVVVGGWSCAPGPGDPDSESLSEADSIVNEWVAAGRIPGAVLLVREGGRVVFQRAYGLSRTEPAPVVMSTTTVFDLASVTKVMATTMSIMMLVDRGAVDLDAPASSYLSDFGTEGKQEITLRHLLTHRAGLAQWQPTYYHATNADEAYQYIRDLPLSWPVGEGRHYSDLGFMLLGRIVEHVGGQPLDEFAEEEVYGPLGLSHTKYRRVMGDRRAVPEPGAFAVTSHGNPFERRMVDDPNFGYLIDVDPDSWNGWRTSWLDGEVNDGNAYHAFQGVAGHAGLFSTAAELGTLLQLLLDHGDGPSGEPLIGWDVVDRFLADTGDEQALGWQLPAWAPSGSFAHTGFTGTFVLGVPETGQAIVLLTNRQNFGVDQDTNYPDVGPLQRAVTAAIVGVR
jgi:CubicO group peptidase (beta-lactamase class C family)